MAKVKKSKKRKLQTPPLSKLDIFIYYAFAILGIVLAGALFYIFGLFIPRELAFSDEVTVASENKNFVEMIFTIPIMLSTVGAFIGISDYGIKKRLPIFGNKIYKPQHNNTVKKQYPLFSKEFKKNFTPEERIGISKVLAVLLLLFAVSIVIMPWGFYPRHTLDTSNNINEYNSFNTLTASQNIEEAEKMIIEIRRVKRTQMIEICFVFGDDSYWFSTGSFHELDMKATLEYMIYLKSFFNDGNYELSNTYNIDALIREYNYTDSEKELIYELFDYKS